jgi:hypothetical protein
VTKARLDGLYLLLLGFALFVFIGVYTECTQPGIGGDFRGVYFGTRCLIEHGDPYQLSVLQDAYLRGGGKLSEDPNKIRASVAPNIYLPSAFILAIPLAMLPWGPASASWIALTAASFILAAFLTWNLAARYAPVIAGGLIGLWLATTEVVFGNGNPAGIVVSLCVVAVCCFIEDRFALAGVLCLAVSLAIKPQDAGLVWLYFLLAGGIYRKRALQTLAVAIALGLAGALWVWHIAPHWIQEWQANLTAISAHGGYNDPATAGISGHIVQAMIDLPTVVSVFVSDPHIYVPVSHLIGAVLLLSWLVATLLSHTSKTNAWLALAAASALSMIVTYHRAYDAKLLLLIVPACAIFWARGGSIARLALIVSTLGIVLTGEIPVALIVIRSRNLHISTSDLAGQLSTVVQTRPATLILLFTCVFYLWIYVRGAFSKGPADESGLPENAPTEAAPAAPGSPPDRH